MQCPFVDGTPRFARIDTSNHEINICVLGNLLYLCLHALPVQTPEEIDPVCQHNSFRKADLRSAERLAHTVGFADRVGIDQRHLQPAGMAECQHGLVQVATVWRSRCARISPRPARRAAATTIPLTPMSLRAR